MSKQSLATKYRPQSFEDVIEQNAVKKILQNQLKNKSFQNAYLFCGPAGDGKALPLDTSILTPTGFILNKDIKVNDVIISGMGRKTKVIGVYPQGVKEVYQVTFNDHTSCECTEDHLWKVRYKDDWEVLSLKQIMKKIEKYTFYIPLPIVNCYKSEAKTPRMSSNLTQGIPDIYKYSSLGIRVNTLHVIMNQYGYEAVGDNNFIKVKTKALSDDLSFLIRSCGGVDTVTFLEGTDEWEHCYQLPKNNAERFITKIELVGEKECQCIKVDDEDHTFLINDFIVTHNTTTARIFANELNEHKGNIIELDAASHNGIDDIRNIIKQAQTQSITGEYKVFLLDECFTPDVEILTDKGFIRFDKLKDEKIAQWEDSQITFVKPLRHIEKDYKGVVYDVKGIKMTPNHVIPLQYKDQTKEEYIKDVKMNRYKSIITSGRHIEGKNKIGNWAKLAIICQYSTLYAQDSQYAKYYHKYDSTLDEILQDLGLQYNSNNERILFNVPLDIDINNYLDLNYSYESARQLIEFTKAYNKNLHFVNNSKQLKYYMALAVLAGYQVKLNVDASETTLELKEQDNINCRHIKKTEAEYEGKVYCVEVSSHKIIVKSNDFIMVNGNCHALSNNAWQALLKIIEEPPAKTMFLMCTTDPQKIPQTILSRVQRYDFKRVSYDGICERLKYILQQENYGDIDEETQKSISYIAKLADGGMRDAITHLDKCLSFGKLNLKNTIRILGTTNYDIMVKLTDNVLNKNKTEVISIIEKIYNVGRDMKTFVKQYMVFLLDVEKYNILQNFKYIQIPETDEYKEWLNTKPNVKSILENIINLNSNIAYSAYPKADLEIAILQCM